MTNNRLLYGVVVLVFVLFVSLYTHPMTYMALYAVLLAPLLSLAGTLLSQRRLTTSEAISPGYAQKGETVRYTFTIQNASPFPAPAVRVRFQADAGIEADHWEAFFSVRPRGSHEAVFHVSAEYRGNYTLGVGEVVFYDFLGLFSRRKTLSKTLVLTVAPRIWTMGPLPLNFTPQDMAQADRYRPAEDYSAISDLRTYQPTDSYKKIHWKASAKRNELISKDFLESKRQAAVFLIDNSAVQASPLKALAREDAMVDALVSAMACCNRLGYQISLHAAGRLDTDFTDNFPELFRCAAELRFGDFGAFDERLNSMVGGRGGPMNFIFIVQTLSEAACLALRSLRRDGSHVVLFYFDPIKDDPQIETLRAFGIHCLNFCETLNG